MKNKTINGMVVVLALSMNANAGIFGDVGDWFSGAYEDTSDFVSHNPGISIGAGLVATSVAEPLALPWAAMGVVAPLYLGKQFIAGGAAEEGGARLAAGIEEESIFEMSSNVGFKNIVQEDSIGGISDLIESGSEQILKDDTGAIVYDSASTSSSAESSAEKAAQRFAQSTKSAIGKNIPKAMLRRINAEQVEIKALTKDFEMASARARVGAAQDYAHARSLRLPEGFVTNAFRDVSDDGLSRKLSASLEDLVTRSERMEIAQAFKEMTQQEVEQMGADLIEMQKIDNLNAVKDGVAFLGKNQINLEVVEAELKNIDPFSKPDNFLKSSYVEKAPSFLSKIKPSNIGKAVSGLVYGAGLGFYKTINKGIGDTVGFGDEALCWLENGDHIECADPTITKTKKKELVNNKDNKYYFDSFIPIDGQDFVPDASVPDIQGINNL